MPLRYHLIIISLIILGVFAGWKLIEAPPPAPPVDESAHRAIEIIRASWGLNCRTLNYSPAETGESRPDGAYADQPATPLHENNAFAPVSHLCNGKSACDLMNAPAALGGDPLPACGDKLLEVEYRCFSYDRPWRMELRPGASGKIDCSRSSGS